MDFPLAFFVFGTLFAVELRKKKKNMKIAIKFHKESGSTAISKVIKVEDINEMKSTLLSVFKDAGCDYVVYLWRDNGMCGVGLGDDGQEKWEHDLEKMSDLIAKRIEEFGYCEIEGEFGEYKGIGITDYDNETFKALAEKGWAR